MKKTQAYFLIFFITLIFLPSFSHSNTPTSLTATVYKNRTDTLYKRCPNPRLDFINSQKNDTRSFGRTQTNASLQIDGDKLIYAYLSNNTEEVKVQLQKSVQKAVIYVIFMLIGIVITLIAGPILLCCICNPDSCPSSCCRQPEEIRYTSCQRIWPAIPLFILGIIAIAAMVAIIVINPQLDKGYKETRCSTSIFFDDLINGNYTKDNSSYFIGIKPLKANLTNTTLLGPNRLLEQQYPAESVLTKIKDSIGQIKRIEKSRNIKQNGKKMESFTSLLDKIQVKVTDIEQQIKDQNKQQYHLATGRLLQFNIFDNYLPSASNSSMKKYADLLNYVQTIDNNTDTTLQEVNDKYINPIYIAIYAIAAGTIVITFILIISVLSICCCKIYGCRHILYLACTLLSVISLIWFVLSVVMSGLAAGSHYGCNYIEGALLNRSQFVYKFEPVFNNQVLTEMIAQCAVKGSDYTVSSVGTRRLLQQIEDSELKQRFEQLIEEKEKLQKQIEQHKNEKTLIVKKLKEIASQINSLIVMAGNGSEGKKDERIGTQKRLLQFVTQLNCKVLGQDLQLITDTFCTQVFNYGFYMRIITIIGSFALLGIMFCSTCLGMKAYKSKRDGQKYQNNRNGGIDSGDAINVNKYYNN